MIHTKKRRRLKRIFYPKNSWFPLHNDVFEAVFPHLRLNRSAHLYMVMYERAQRHPSKPFAANLSDLAKMIGCDTRTARRCIGELRKKGFVAMVDKGGKLRSRTNKPTFAVPLTQQKVEEGGWFPVPRFLVTDYLRQFKGGLVLIALLYHQHMKWKKDCWCGVKRLADVLGMKERRVYGYLHVAGHEHKWKRLGNGLPWPVETSYSADGQTRHFSVRCAEFYTPPGARKPVVGLSDEFADYFGRKIHAADDDDDEND